MVSATTIVQPTPAQIARAAAAAIPSEVSKRPLIGILGVVTGAGLVTLTGRMLSLGMPDLRGHLGIGYDAGAWLDSAYNASLMFIGPFSVYLGGLLGPRRILLFAAGSFALTCVYLPFVHSYSLLIAALMVAGLTSGTFYPLTLTFALRNIPLRYLPFTIALYATFVDGAVNVAPSLYGWYRDSLSWQWMFWGSAVIAPVMMLCIYFGIPAPPPRKENAPSPSFAGFLYLSFGLAMVFAALQQGERLEQLDPPSLPQTPARPKRLLIVSVGTGLGLMAGLCMAGLRELSTGALRNARDLSACAQLPVLGSIPLFEAPGAKRRRKRAAWLVWSASSLMGLAIMSTTVAHYYLSRL